MNLSRKTVVLFATSIFFSASILAQDTLSRDQKMNAIKSLETYDKQSVLVNPQGRPQAQSPSTQTDDIVASAETNSEVVIDEVLEVKVPEFVCNENSEQNCEMQQFLNKLENRQPPVFISGGKYKVSVFFSNDNNFPIKYAEKKSFESVSEQNRVDMENRIFEYFLGLDYAFLKPELLNVYYNVVGIAVFVESSDGLNKFLDDPKIQGIYHIGNDSDVEEGYH